MPLARSLPPVLLLGVLASTAHAQNRRWEDNGTAWATITNWNGNVPDTAAETAVFDGDHPAGAPVGGGIFTNNPDTGGATITVYGIDLMDGVMADNHAGTGHYTASFDITGGGTFNLGEGGFDIVPDAFDNLNAPNVTANNRQARIFLDQNWNLTEDQVWQIDDSAGIHGPGNNQTIDARINLTGTVTGSAIWVKEGAGQLYMQGNNPNTFTGKYIHNGGTTELRLQNLSLIHI